MTRDTNRRDFLRGTAATLAVAGVAGCLDSGGGGGNDGTDTSDEIDDGGMTPTDDGMGGMTDTDNGMGGMTDTDDGMGGMTPTDDGMGGMTDTGDGMGELTTFEVTVTNVSEAGTITTSTGDDLAVPLSPVAFAVHTDEAAAFTAGEAASDGLEALAEDGMASGLAGELESANGVHAAGAAATADGADGPGPIGPGGSYTFEVTAEPTHRLSVVTMFVQSNDLFYAPDPEGIALFEDGDPLAGDVTDRIRLWDAGTEENEEPGVGENQAPRQSGPDTGPSEMGTVRPIEEVMDGYDYPDVSDVIEVRVGPPSM